MNGRVPYIIMAAVAALLASGGTAWAQVERLQYPASPRAPQSSESGGLEWREGTWSGGAGLGIVGDTPDGTAFGVNASLETFISDQVSIGPLLQTAFTDDLNQLGLSGQAKYWLDAFNGGRGKLTLQAGFGAAFADFRDDDISWLIPLGVGLDYEIDPNLSVDTTLLLNLTDLDTGGGSGADVMPGLMVGVHF